MINDWVDYVIATMIAILFALVIFLGYLLFKAATDDRVCAVGHYEKRNGTQFVGNVPMTVSYNSYVCDVWENND